MIVRLISFLFFAFSLVAMPIAAAAETNDERAAALKQHGDELFDSLRHEEAIAAYTESYAIVPDAAVLYNRGRAYQALGRYPDALADFEAFARTAPPTLRARVAGLDALIAAVRARVAHVAVECDVKARVIVRDRVVGETPLLPFAVNAGPAKVEVAADGYFPYVTNVDLAGGTVVHVRATLVAKARAGTLVVRAPVGSRVAIDGRDLGQPPLERVLDAGEHVVVVEKPGFSTAKNVVQIVAGTRREIDVSLEPPPSIVTRWWFWTAVGVVVVGGVTTAIVLTSTRGADSGSIQPGRVAAPLVRF
jgi:hypothetical protein